MVSSWEELKAVFIELRDDRRRPLRGVSGPSEHDAEGGVKATGGSEIGHLDLYHV